MAGKYQYWIMIVGYDKLRRKELNVYFKHLFPKAGLDFYNSIFDQVDGGEPFRAYESNSRADAHRTAMTLATYGAQVEVHPD